MTTRINEAGPLPLVESTRTAPRITPAASEPFRSVMQAGARAVVEGAESAVLQLPGGPVLAAAFRSPPYGTTSAALGVAPGSDSTEYENYAAEGPSPVGTSDSGSVYVASGGLPARIDRIDVATGSRTHLRDLAGVDGAGMVSRSAARVTPDGRTMTLGFSRALSTLYWVRDLK